MPKLVALSKLYRHARQGDLSTMVGLAEKTTNSSRNPMAGTTTMRIVSDEDMYSSSNTSFIEKHVQDMYEGKQGILTAVPAAPCSPQPPHCLPRCEHGLAYVTPTISSDHPSRWLDTSSSGLNDVEGLSKQHQYSGVCDGTVVETLRSPPRLKRLSSSRCLSDMVSASEEQAQEKMSLENSVCASPMHYMPRNVSSCSASTMGSFSDGSSLRNESVCVSGGAVSPWGHFVDTVAVEEDGSHDLQDGQDLFTKSFLCSSPCDPVFSPKRSHHVVASDFYSPGSHSSFFARQSSRSSFNPYPRRKKHRSASTFPHYPLSCQRVPLTFSRQFRERKVRDKLSYQIESSSSQLVDDFLLIGNPDTIDETVEQLESLSF